MDYTADTTLGAASGQGDTWDYLQSYATEDPVVGDTATPDSETQDGTDRAQQVRWGKAIRAAAQPLAQFGKRWSTRLGNIPTPGNLGMMLLVLVLLLCFLVQVGASNETRMQLMWDVLLGKKALNAYIAQNTTPPSSLNQTDTGTQSILDAVLTQLGVDPSSLNATQTAHVQDQILLAQQELPGGNGTAQQIIAAALPLVKWWLGTQGLLPSTTSSGGPGGRRNGIVAGPNSTPRTGQSGVAWEDIPPIG